MGGINGRFIGNVYFSFIIFWVAVWDIWRLICLDQGFPAYHTVSRDRLEQTWFSALMTVSLISSVHMIMSGHCTLPPCWPFHTSELSLPPLTLNRSTHVYHKTILHSVTGAHVLSCMWGHGADVCDWDLKSNILPSHCGKAAGCAISADLLWLCEKVSGVV